MRKLLFISALYCFGMAVVSFAVLVLTAIRATLRPGLLSYDVASIFWLSLTGFGLLERWPWSRISIQIVGVLQLLGGVSAVNTAMNHPHGITPVPLTLPVLQAVLGLFWLVFFNLPKVRQGFREAR